MKDNYYNSDLNEYIGLNLPKVMTAIDVDLLEWKHTRKIMRFVEYKHTNEKIGPNQLKALEALAEIAKVINQNSNLFDGKKMQVMIVRGDKPFKQLKITDLITDKNYVIIGKENVDDFLCVNEIILNKEIIETTPLFL